MPTPASAARGRQERLVILTPGFSWVCCWHRPQLGSGPAKASRTELGDLSPLMVNDRIILHLPEDVRIRGRVLSGRDDGLLMNI